MTEYRIERDSLGEVQVPVEATWAAQTQRSIQNFPIGSEGMPEELMRAFIHVKRAAAQQNAAEGKLPQEKADLIAQVADEVLAEENIMKHFPLRIWQTGSGTQSNMNVNEVLSHLANKKATGVTLHPNDDLNMSQSSNDTFPTAMNMAARKMVIENLLPEMDEWIKLLGELEEKYSQHVKIGRTHLQDATPLTFGQEISGWKAMIERNRELLAQNVESLAYLPIGGTAVGTGLNASAEYPEGIVNEINKAYFPGYKSHPNKFYGLTSHSDMATTHGSMTALAGDLMKIANDIRWLASGPRCGIGEITIPSNEPGSSIMPGKVNPTQAEALTMVVAQVMGNHTTIQFSASQGNFELNVYKPVIMMNFVQSVNLLATGMASFRERCLAGIEVSDDRMTGLLNDSLMLVTALNPHVGYDTAAKIAKHAFANNLKLIEAAVELTDLTKEKLIEILDPKHMLK
ncbi:class II fumarate hydratase [Vagococcus coleopterorum]|uniref:Fumarate hydratase class II n=1 Tax=Vagococcus coleopterorum TaxID=2714946 RepID=A0A6G8AML0_9ENTE|nr:class II fumarate hydratase [Vagococcus coleopterorum]QIL46163.1 class II fumarate hydratase [Vagococcus coleopterorum]